MERDLFIIQCSQCGVKNRIREYPENRIPVCARCKQPLVDADKNDAHARYAQNLKKLYDLPGFGGDDT